MTTTPVRLRVNDSLTRGARPIGRTTDTLLLPATPAELQAAAANVAPTDLGKVWDGTFKPILDGLSKANRDALMEQLTTYIEAQNGPHNSDPNSPTMVGDANRSARQTIDSIAAINAANRDFWAQVRK
jgi:hypothetical protein